MQDFLWHDLDYDFLHYDAVVVAIVPEDKFSPKC
jgi:hypothetical protein